MSRLTLQFLPGTYAIHRLNPDAEIPNQIFKAEFFSVVKTRDEISIVCPEEINISGGEVETDWVCLKVLGPLDFSLTGILAGISTCLAEADISIFAISTYDTDYILVKAKDQAETMTALRNSRYRVLAASDSCD